MLNVAFPVARFTTTSETPSTFAIDFSTLVTQLAQVIPSTGTDIFSVLIIFEIFSVILFFTHLVII